MESPASDPSAPAPTPSPAFLDVHALIDQSQPAARGNLMWYGIGAFALVVIASSVLSSQSESSAMLVRFLSSLAMIGVIAVMSLITWSVAKRRRAELQQLEAIEELVHLRRWDEAAAIVQQLLSRPTRTPHARIHGLLFLSSILARYHRFDDTVIVQNYLLEHVQLDPSSDYGLRLGRAMAMLQADHLFDADRAIVDLRRASQDSENDSGGLALVEIYRDVKTGHPDEAVRMFESKLPALREQLGARVADAYALAARGYDLLGREDEAARAFESATLLAPVSELTRRYPEVVPLTKKFVAVETPNRIREPAAEPRRFMDSSSADPTINNQLTIDH